MARLTGEIHHNQVVSLSVTVLPLEDEADYNLQICNNGQEIVSANDSVSGSFLGHSDYYLFAKGFINASKLIGDYSEISISSRNVPSDRPGLPCCVRLDCEKLGAILHCFTRKKRGVVVNTLRVLLLVLDDRLTQNEMASGAPWPAAFRVVEFECTFEAAAQFGIALLNELDAALIERRQRGAQEPFDEFEDPSGYYERD